MSPSARLFHCARCHCQVILCRACDRGNVYCDNGCAQAARRASLRRASARYRRTRRGRLNNAERQRRFRARQQNVTHHRSAARPPPAVLPDIVLPFATLFALSVAVTASTFKKYS